MIDAQSIALRIAVGEQPRLQHLVGGEADAGHDVGGIECRLLYFGKVIVGIAVEFHDTDFDQGVVLVRPHLGQVEGMVGRFCCVLFGHDLDVERPFRIVAVLDARVEILLMAFAIFADDRFGLGIAQILDALLGPQMEFHSVAFVSCVDEAEGMGSEAVHVAISSGQAALAHDDGDLMQGFRQ